MSEKNNGCSSSQEENEKPTSASQEQSQVQSSGEVTESSGSKASATTSSSARTTASSGDTVPTQETQECPNDVVQSQKDGIWGVMHALQPQFVHLNLIEDRYVFGRGRTCDYCLDLPSVRKTKLFKNYSKEHFCVYRTLKPDGSTDQVFVEDFGGCNGTFINGERIPKKSMWLIKARDKIAMSNPMNDVFLFMESENPDSEFHEDFRKKYVVHRLLGRGACGQVHEVWGKQMTGRFAAKVINKVRLTGCSMQPAVLNRDIRTEAVILTKLDHPCVIGIHDVIDTPKELYIVLQYAGGGELFERLQNNGRLSEPTAKLFFYQMLCAVVYLHEHDITHRDLKPENILLMSNEEQCLIKITDFGMSRLVEEQSLMKTLVGTPSYLAPEILQHAGSRLSVGYTKLVDLWSLGVVLYVCLAAYPPFSKQRPDTEQTIDEQIVSGNYKFHHDNWSKISAEAKNLICRLLQVEASRRLTSSQAMAHVWLDDAGMLCNAKQIMYPGGNPGSAPSPMGEKKLSTASADTRKISTDNDDSPACAASRLTSVDSGEYLELLTTRSIESEHNIKSEKRLLESNPQNGEGIERNSDEPPAAKQPKND